MDTLIPKLPSLSYAGIPILKNPLDLFMVQEILWANKPDFLVECGTCCGGSALYFAHLFDQIGKGEVISIDLGVEKWLQTMGGPGKLPTHPRVRYIHGRSSVDSSVLALVGELVGGGTVMVDLDSSHITEHVAKELEAYAPLVTPGQMLVIEDSFLDEGPLPAIRAFFPGKEEWVNTSLEEYKFGRRLTYNPEGWWMKKVGGSGVVVGGRS